MVKLGIDTQIEESTSSTLSIIRERVTAFINKADREFGIKLRITSDGHLRSFDKQDELYAQGRTAPGKIITNAKAGESYHNYGLAFDLVEIKDGQALWNNPNWIKIGEIGKSFGFNWGGDWRSFKDYPHFELSNGLNLADLKWKYLNNEITNSYVNLT